MTHSWSVLFLPLAIEYWDEKQFGFRVTANGKAAANSANGAAESEVLELQSGAELGESTWVGCQSPRRRQECLARIDEARTLVHDVVTFLEDDATQLHTFRVAGETGWYTTDGKFTTDDGLTIELSIGWKQVTLPNQPDHEPTISLRVLNGAHVEAVIVADRNSPEPRLNTLVANLLQTERAKLANSVA